MTARPRSAVAAVVGGLLLCALTAPGLATQAQAAPKRQPVPAVVVASPGAGTLPVPAVGTPSVPTVPSPAAAAAPRGPDPRPAPSRPAPSRPAPRHLDPRRLDPSHPTLPAVAPSTQHAPVRTPVGKVLYLTFDDGPSPTWTPKVLAVLARHHAHATFFQVGSEARAHQKTAALVLAAGHRVGNHTSHHRDLTELDSKHLLSELRGGVASSCVRPPYGAVDAKVRKAARGLGQQVVLWNVDTRDWARPGAGKVRDALVEGARPGRTVLMHDGGGGRSQTVAGLDAGLTILGRRGYRFASLPQC